MIRRITAPAVPATPASPATESAGPARPAADTSFAATLARPASPPAPAARPGSEEEALLHRLARSVAGLEQRRESIDRVIRRAARGQTFAPTELLALQAQVYVYSQQMELVSRSVDRVVGGLKTTLNTQV